MVDLSKFTSGRINQQYAKPWSFGDYSYATDGHVAVRVPKIDSIPVVEKFQERTKQIDGWINAEPGKWFDVVFKQIELQQCIECSGHGYLRLCEECKGEGFVYFKTDYNDYSVTCRSCSGYSVQPASKTNPASVPCEECDGSGKVYPDLNETTATEYGGRKYNDILLSKLSVFKNVKIKPMGKKDPAVLQFDEGMGLLMPTTF